MLTGKGEEQNTAFENYFRTSSDLPTLKETYLTGEEIQKLEDTVDRIRADRYHAEGSISDIDQVGELLRKLLNAAWGSDWGELSPELSLGESPEETKLPAITYDIVSRETASGIGRIKPTQIESYSEIVDGKPTGDVIMTYSQLFDCLVEFNCWGQSSLEARNLLNRLEKILTFHSGFLKEQGIQEMFFLKEIPAKQSIHYLDDYYMKSMIYFIRLERKSFVRQSTFKDIEVKVLEEDKSTGQTKPVDIYNNSL